MNVVLTKLLIDLALWGLAALLAYAFRKPGLINEGIPLNVWGYVLLSVAVMAALAWRYHLPRQNWQRASVPSSATGFMRAALSQPHSRAVAAGSLESSTGAAPRARSSRLIARAIASSPVFPKP